MAEPARINRPHESYDGVPVTVWGLGRHGGGVNSARFLAERGARVRAVDRLSAEELAESVAALDGLDIEFRLGEERAEDVLGCDLLVVNPAIRPDTPLLQEALRVIPDVTSELGLTCRHLPTENVIAVTGTNGKSSVCFGIACLLPDDPLGSMRLDCFLGGNFEIGLIEGEQTPFRDRQAGPLLNCVRRVRPQDWVVLEVSSFQGEHLRMFAETSFRPRIAVITSLSPNHCDWHGDYASYVRAKQWILEQVGAAGGTVIFGSGVEIGELEASIGRAIRCPPSPSRISNGWAIHHAVRLAAGHDSVIDGPTISGFVPYALPHRVREISKTGAVRWVDDSASTTPESTNVALNSSDDRSVVLIAGGRNKGFDLDAFAREIAPRCHAVATIGETASELAKLVAVHGGRVRSCRTLEKAVTWASKMVPENGVVLLSPGMASTDQFTDYRERGRRFQELARAVCGESGPERAA